MKHDDLYRNARFGGLVHRWHTWPTLSTQEVGTHTWQLFRIYWFIWGPSIEPEVTTALVWHDAPELFAGDGSYPAKRAIPALKKALDQAEAYGRIKMGGPNNFEKDLTLDQIKRIKICDNMDMLEHGLHEFAMGNRFMLPVIDVTYQAVVDMATDLPIEETLKVGKYLNKLREFVEAYGILEAWPGPKPAGVAFTDADFQPAK